MTQVPERQDTQEKLDPRLASAGLEAMKQPLHSIDMAAQLLSMEGLSQEQRGEMCGRILEQSQKLKSILDRLK